MGERIDGSLERGLVHARFDVITQIDEHRTRGVGQRVPAESALELIDPWKRKHSLNAW